MSHDTIEKIFLWSLGICSALLVLLFIVSVIGDGRLYDQCRADGYKEYECVSMLRGKAIR